jgi:hypothetical protein
MAGEQGGGGGDPGGREDGIGEGAGGLGELDFTGEEEEGVILPDGSAEGEAELIVADDGLAAADGGDRRDGGEVLVAVEEEDVAVDVVGSAFEHHVGVGAGVAAGVGFGVGGHGELVDGLDGDETAGDSGDAALVGGDGVGPGVVVVDAIDLVVDAGGAGAVDGAGDVDDGGELDHLGEVTPVHGHVLHLFGVDDADQRAGGGVGGDAVGDDIDDGVLGTDAHLDLNVLDLGYLDVDIVDLFGLEAGGDDGELIGAADGQFGEEEFAGGVGLGVEQEAGGGIGELHGGVGDDGALHVGDGSGEGSAEGLGAEVGGEEEEEEETEGLSKRLRHAAAPAAEVERGDAKGPSPRERRFGAATPDGEFLKN